MPIHSISICSSFSVDPCLYLTCKDFKVCHEKSDGTGECRCPECELSGSNKAVCDVTKATHFSACHLNRLKCHMNEEIQISSKGVCGMNDFLIFPVTLLLRQNIRSCQSRSKPKK